MKISSPVAKGNGAYVIHQNLESKIPGYLTLPYHPYWSLVPASLKFFSDHNADIIHATADYASFFAIKDKPLVVTLHNYVVDRFMRDYSSKPQQLHYRLNLKRYIQRSFKQADRMIAVSHFTGTLARKDLGYTGDIQVIPNGVDAERFSPLKPKKHGNKIRVLFSGNLSLRKGVQWLPGIADSLNKQIEIVYTQGLKNNKHVLHAPNMRTIGAVPYLQMPHLYNDVDILLMPTVREGMSLAVLEAMACGLPVVASDCSSMPELIEQGKGGYLCEIGDCAGFADRINELADNRQLRLEMGEFNRARIEQHYTLPAMIRAYQQVFELLLS